MRIINILHFEKIDSTNTYARNNIRNLPLPSIIIADEQTAGRGRRGNRFFSPKETGLYMTLVIDEPIKSDLITPATAVAVCKVLERKGIKPEIKWVNDLFIKNKKFCGILSERIITETGNVIAIGIGINLTTKTFPDDLPSAGSINLETEKISLAKEIANEVIIQINSSETVSEYRERLFILGKEIEYSYNGIICSAKAIDINEYCNLTVLNTDGTLRVLTSGEISIKI